MFSLTTPAISLASVVGILGAVATFFVFKELNQQHQIKAILLIFHF